MLRVTIGSFFEDHSLGLIGEQRGLKQNPDRRKKISITNLT